MKRKRVVITWILFVILVLSQSRALRAEDEEYYYGCIPASEEEKQLIPEAETPTSGAELPSRWDLSSQFPIPKNQGGQPSCTAWAVGYAYKGYLEKRERMWEVNEYNNQFSPAYIYNQRKNRDSRGMSILEAIKITMDFGICSFSKMPYNQFSSSQLPSNEAHREAKYFKSVQYSSITQPTGISYQGKLKAHLYAREPLVIAIPVYPDFNSISNENPVYDEAVGTTESYHAIVLTGYDDELKAYKFINSWGTNWGLGEYGYIAYDFVDNYVDEIYMIEDGGWKFSSQARRYIVGMREGQYICEKSMVRRFERMVFI